MPAIEGFGVGTMNVPAAKGQAGDLSRQKTRACLAQAAAHVGLLGTQETIEAEDNADIDAVLKPKEWYHFAESSENDILVKRSRWRPASPARLRAQGINPVYGQGHRDLSKGLAGVTPRRDATWVILDWIARPTWDSFVFLDSHFVSGVYAGNDHLEFRKKARADEMEGVTALLANWKRKGLNVIFVLDSNWAEMPVPVPGFRWVVNDGIDKIGYVNAPGSNWALSFVDAERWPNASDHDFRVANLTGQERVRPVPPVPPVPVLTVQQRVDSYLATIPTTTGTSAINAADRLALHTLTSGV